MIQNIIKTVYCLSKEKSNNKTSIPYQDQVAMEPVLQKKKRSTCPNSSSCKAPPCKWAIEKMG